MNKVIDFKHRHYAHCESGVISSLLTHSGLELSEPMVFGIGGGISFAFLPFIKINGMPLIAYRIIPKFIIRNVQKRLGINFKKKSYRNQNQAMEELSKLIANNQPVALQTSVYWLPYFPQEMRFQFNSHNLIVFGKEDDEYIISDPVFDSIQRIKSKDLQNARFVKGVLAPKGFSYYPIDIPEELDLKKVIKKSIKKGSRMMLNAPKPFGLKGIHYMAKKIEKQASNINKKYVKHYLGHIVRMQEEIGTGGGGFRFLYAAFLQEASKILGITELEKASRGMTETGDLWRTLALACANACKSKNDDMDLKAIADIARDCAESEKKIHKKVIEISIKYF